MTARRQRPRLSELKGTLKLLQENGLRPVALDCQPDGTYRWHFTEPVSSAEDALDRELAEFGETHGYGRA
jgi:hypothetical protein